MHGGPDAFDGLSARFAILDAGGNREATLRPESRGEEGLSISGATCGNELSRAGGVLEAFLLSRRRFAFIAGLSKAGGLSILLSSPP